MSLGSLRRVQGTVWASTVDPADQATLDPGVPADLDRHPDVLVVGGGVIGLATAVCCRRAGVGRVLVIEAARLAAAASGGAGGALAPRCTGWATRPPSWRWPGPAWHCIASSTTTGTERWG